MARYQVQEGGDIVTVHVHPRIPLREWDWCCYKEGDARSLWAYGWGATEEEALKDFHRLWNYPEKTATLDKTPEAEPPARQENTNVRL